MNEAQNLPGVLERLPGWLHEVIVVDGGSTDGTIEAAQATLPSVQVLRQTGRGKGQALREGFRKCTGSVVVAMDADGSMDPAEIGRLVAPLAGGCHYVKGSRTLPGGASDDLTLLRRFGNWGLRSVANLVHRTRYSDLCYGYFSFLRGTVDALPLESDGFEIETEIAVKARQAGLVVVEVPSQERARANGNSHLRAFPDGWRILRTVLKHKFRPGPRDVFAVDRLGLELSAPAAWSELPAGYFAYQQDGHVNGNPDLSPGLLLDAKAFQDGASSSPADA